MTRRARPVRHQPRAAVPRRRVRGAARARGRRLRADRRRRAPRRRRGAGADAAVPGRLRRASAPSRGWPPRAATARWSPGSPGASRCPPPTPARARARVPFVLWATIWRHPRTPAHALSYLPLRHLYRHADAIATYGPHVCAYVRAKDATRRRSSRRPRASTTRSGARPASPSRHGDFQVAVCRPTRAGKGRRGAAQAWRASGSQHRRRAGPGRRRPDPSPGRRRRRGCAARRAAPPNCATSTRAATLWSYRRSPRATSSSRGGSSSTKPSTRESP